MALNYESAVINGQLVPVPPAQAFSPLSYGTELSGPGFWPRGGQWNLPPLLPNPTAVVSTTEYTPSSGVVGSNGGPTAGGVNAQGKVNWLHPTKSPALWGIGLLALSLFMLHKVHYGSGK